MEPPALSIIVPTRNEAANLPALTARISAAVRDLPYELIIVDDDSHDGTPEVCSDLAAHFPLKLITRTGTTDGLGGAVLRGIAESKSPTLLVMDADLQHPPESIPELLSALDNGALFALGSRYIPGGSTATKWGAVRKFNSRFATLLAHPFSGHVSDPMSGFFALRRSTFDRAARLAPLGYKIGLELMCKCRVTGYVSEVPIHFAARTQGQSKLTLSEQFRYLEHLSRLYDFTFPRASSYIKFSIVLAISWACGAAMTRALIQTGTPPAASISASYFANILVTAIFHMRYVRVQRKYLVVSRPWGAFCATCLAEWITCAASSSYFWRNLKGPTTPEVFLLAYTAATVIRYVFRKELSQDLRGLRKELRREEITGQ